MRRGKRCLNPPQNAKPSANLNPSPEGFLSYMLILLFSPGRAIITSSA
nr:MAG TPA: hypothetical protein [Caudoviricetes sp.]